MTVHPSSAKNPASAQPMSALAARTKTVRSPISDRPGGAHVRRAEQAVAAPPPVAPGEGRAHAVRDPLLADGRAPRTPELVFPAQVGKLLVHGSAPPQGGGEAGGGR